MIIFVSLLLCIAFLIKADSSQSCALKFQDSDVCACSSYDSDGPVRCQIGSNLLEIKPCYCAYFDQNIQKLLVGHCYYTCYRYHSSFIDVVNVTQFNSDFCSDELLNRRGFFCYECNASYGLSTNSEPLIDCKCTEYGYRNWFKYFAMSLLPITVLYILAILLKCNITTGSLGGIVLVLQCITSSSLATYDIGSTKGVNALIKLVFGVIEMTSLYFFDTYHWTHSCLHPELNIFQKRSLRYIKGLYPFLLIFITYILVAAYDRVQSHSLVVETI